ncbi:hypothetical protein BJ986_002311 [Phycicoccus badiiscoriae]|uniref:Uncharacterized protein n=1 Tax=Pedococcus badiiscoriae TaxID=642776 RepID=A0A852WM24_9MICO|nr:hypothetical protein [Pedococcus badiiscoriae]NYG07824.1 hypothetical protein [Pedococcus badiiscoriae]
MAGFDLTPDQLAKSVYTDRFAALARADVDLATWKTWDPHLVREKRILVPVDVQAYVVPAGGQEVCVDVAGVDGDPAPFDAGAVRPAGVHLHWALPDALLRGENDPVTKKVVLPRLPDRWVVVRTLLPEGARTAYASGWVLDAVTCGVTPLATYAGAVPPGSPPLDGGVPMAVLDGAARGSLLWTSTYDGAINRFALHDPLTDLPGLEVAPHGFHRGKASYTVAGWWTDSGADPLAGSWGQTGVRARLAELGWWVSPDGEDAVDYPEDPRTSKLEQYAGLTSPRTYAPMTVQTPYAKSTTAYSAVAPETALPVAEVAAVTVGIGTTRYHTMLHGSVLGVPVDGTAGGADDRPDPSTLAASLGTDLDDIVSAFAAPALGVDPGKRLTAERLCAAFTGDLLGRIGTPDGLSDLADQEHANGFWALPGRPLAGAKADRLRTEDSTPFGPLAVGRKGRAATQPVKGSGVPKGTKVGWRGVAPLTSGKHTTVSDAATGERDDPGAGTRKPGTPPPASRDVARAAPRVFRPAPLMVGLRGVHPSARHHGDGMFDDHGLLRCRFPGEVSPSIHGSVDGRSVLPTLGNGAVPSEVTRVVREAIIVDGYSVGWLAASSGRTGADAQALEGRLTAEMLRLYGTTATYDGSGTGLVAAAARARMPRAAAQDAWSGYSQTQEVTTLQVAAELSRFSLVAWTPPSPIAITTWRQPWVPLWLEWRVELTGTEDLGGWSLVDGDLRRTTPVDGTTRTLTGRSPLTTGVGKSLTTAMAAWLAQEDSRDLASPSQSLIPDADENVLTAVANLVRPLDLCSASFDGVREQLLGIAYEGYVQRVRGTDGVSRPRATGLPVPLFGGTLSVLDLRLVDAFGRVVEIPLTGLARTSTQELPDKPTGVLLPPRIQNSARWLLRLVDPAYGLDQDPADAPEAYVDQLRAPLAVTPVSGFLLPDHIDEGLEVFDRDGNPLGQLEHDSFSVDDGPGSVRWDPAPGRPVPPDAGPLTDIPAHAQHVALFAAGLVQADIEARQAATPPSSSALSALLRAIDSTLWTVDTFAAIGTPTIAGLVGRPVAVVRATLRLDAPDDVDEVQVDEGGGPAARLAAYSSLAAHEFPFRIGELGRSDDSVLGFFVDDDYTRFHVVDKVVADSALASGPRTGFLGRLGDTPGHDPIDHGYLVLEDTLTIRIGQTVRLTILMLPAGKVHVTSGILPRKALELADTWVGPGLARMVPSMRVGPLLVDPAEIRLPNVASLGGKQQFTRRTGPISWKDDPILASTTNAYLPKMPHEVQEGWIRVAPDEGATP